MRMGPIFASIIQIQIHLTSICVCKFPELQVHDDQALKPAMKENQINPVPLRSDAQSLLSGHECEIIPQLQQKLFEALDKGIFELRLRVFVLQIQELENEWISYVSIG